MMCDIKRIIDLIKTCSLQNTTNLLKLYIHFYIIPIGSDIQCLPIIPTFIRRRSLINLNIGDYMGEGSLC